MFSQVIDFMTTYPLVYSADDRPVACKVDEAKLLELRDSLPARKTHSSLRPINLSVGQKRADPSMAQIAQVLQNLMPMMCGHARLHPPWSEAQALEHSPPHAPTLPATPPTTRAPLATPPKSELLALGYSEAAKLAPAVSPPEPHLEVLGKWGEVAPNEVDDFAVGLGDAADSSGDGAASKVENIMARVANALQGKGKAKSKAKAKASTERMANAVASTPDARVKSGGNTLKRPACAMMASPAPSMPPLKACPSITWGPCTIYSSESARCWRVTCADNRRYDKRFSWKNPTSSWAALVAYCTARQ